MAKNSLSKAPREPSEGTKKGRKSGGNREREIIEAAVEIFHQRGYSATSVDDIAHVVGILKGSLYYYMDSKEDLLLRIVEDVHEEVEELLQESISDVSKPPLDRLASYIVAQVDYNARNVKRVRVYYHDYDQLSAARLASVRKRRRANERALINVIKEAKNAGEVPKGLNERLAAKTIFGSIIWTYTWFKPGGAVSGSELGSFCADFALDGLRGGAGAKVTAPPKALPRKAP